MSYPFAELTEGKSFTVPIEAISDVALQAIVAQASNHYGKNYTYITHEDLGMYEISIAPVFVPIEVVNSSPKMQQSRSKYQFESLEVGMSFTLPIVGTNEGSLRVLCNTYSKKLDRKFKCAKHTLQGVLEVGRVL